MTHLKRFIQIFPEETLKKWIGEKFDTEIKETEEFKEKISDYLESFEEKCKEG